MSDVPLPDKLYYRIGEVARLVGVKPYVLRYWESEFSLVRPGKTRARHRLYRRRDVERLREIRQLLYVDGYTIAGARRRLRQRATARAAARAAPRDTTALAEMRAEIADLCRLLDREPEHAPPLAIGPRPEHDDDEAAG